ncbi:hypothetical protein [Alkaliphilus transvaalensis]|uniref:hypothetical protein n=1 Tax=Alkaliphilus transvaalensis TaxID=114628 RepID=UPI00047C3AD4|nr:hypothetical protein [Alkaliphilus transvaalensis]
MIISEAKVIIEGIDIIESFELKKYIFEDYVEKVFIKKLDNKSIAATFNIKSEDKNKNFLIANEFKEFLIKLFSLFGVCTRIKGELEINTSNDFLAATVEVRPPMRIVGGNEINLKSHIMKDNMENKQANEQFFNLIESNKNINMLHRFRALFSVFDSLAPKKNGGIHINYELLASRFESIIKQIYVEEYLERLLDIINEFIIADLKDTRSNPPKCFSKNIEEEREKLHNGTCINSIIAFNLLKCIQVTRNKINHGDFNNVSYKVVAASYELLLPLTQELMKDQYNCTEN